MIGGQAITSQRLPITYFSSGLLYGDRQVETVIGWWTIRKDA
jgi:hypothetical protein